MARIVTAAERKKRISYQLIYENAGGGSYWFPCTPEGELLPYPLSSFARNMARIEQNPASFRPPRLEEIVHRWIEPGRLECDCSREVRLEGDVICECGQAYNSFGQKLGPISQWGEETGETFANSFAGVEE